VKGLKLSGRLISWCLVYEAAVYGLGLVVIAGLIPAWGQWYSESEHHRAQVNALLQGRLALSHDPARLDFDLAWAEGGVHQVWGLGVPLWRLPFELVVRLVGTEGFPDMLAFAAALALAAWALWQALLGGLWRRANGDSLPEAVAAQRLADGDSAAWVAWLIGASGLALLFPPFLNLLSAQFAIYQEVIAYEYVFGVVLIACLMALVQWPTVGRYWGLCALAGLGGLVRPTLVLHGIAMLLSGTMVCWLRGRQTAALSAQPRPDAAAGAVGSTGAVGSAAAGAEAASAGGAVLSLSATAGPRPARWASGRRLLGSVVVALILFGAGGGVLYVTNLLRFGSGFEFGHKLNVQHGGLNGSLYATRFDHPYSDEPFLSAARELFGLLFLCRELRAGDYYRQNMFPGQSPTVRWRAMGPSTYDVSYLVWMIGGWVAAVVAGWRLRREAGAKPVHGLAGAAQPLMLVALGLYSAVGTVLLLGFYLRNCVIATRYMLDLMPAFVAAMLAGWLAWGRLWAGHRGWRWAWAASGLALVFWLGWQITHARTTYGPARILTWNDVVSYRGLVAKREPVRFPPSGCYESALAAAQTAMPFNGVGWERDSGRLMPCVILFVDDPEFLELELEPVAEVAGRVPADPAQIRAKVGLEFLRRERIDRTAKGWRVRFSGPRQKRYQRGVQPVFLATVPKEFLADYTTVPWRLTRVTWRAPSPAQ